MMAGWSRDLSVRAMRSRERKKSPPWGAGGGIWQGIHGSVLYRSPTRERYDSKFEVMGSKFRKPRTSDPEPSRFVYPPLTQNPEPRTQNFFAHLACRAFPA